MEIVLIILVVVALLIVIAVKGGNTEKGKNEVSEDVQAHSLTTSEGFTPAVTFKDIIGSYGLALDPSSEQLAIVIPGSAPRLYHFSQVVAAEIEKDGETITTTKGKVHLSGAAVATALIGPLGMALGAKTSSTSTSTTTITKLSLKLYLNDIYTPCFEISFITPWMTDTDKASAAANLDNWYGRIRTILIGLERQGVPIDTAKAVAHSGPAPMPVDPNAGKSWAGRVFGS